MRSNALPRLLIALLAGLAAHPLACAHEPPPEKAYRSPDGKTYVSPGGWKDYEPRERRIAKGEAAFPKQAVLLTSERDVAERISVGSLVGYMKAIEAETNAVFAAAPRGAATELMIEPTLQPDGKPKFRIATRAPAVADAVLHKLAERIEALPAPPVHGEVKIQLFYSVWSGPPPR